MKQGRADKSGMAGQHKDPISHAIHETAPAQMGLAVQFEKKPLLAGAGYRGSNVSPAKAGPGGGRTIYHCGTQGKHK